MNATLCVCKAAEDSPSMRSRRCTLCRSSVRGPISGSFIEAGFEHVETSNIFLHLGAKRFRFQKQGLPINY